MTNLSVWSAAPRFDAKTRKAERESLSLAEVEAALLDVNGSPEATRNEDTNQRRVVTDGDLAELDSAICSILECDKLAFLKASGVSPDLVRSQSMLFLVANKSEDIKASSTYCHQIL